MFHTSFTIEVAALAQRTKHATTLRVFLILPAHLSYTTFRELPGERLASALDVDQTSVSRAMRELAELGAVERCGKGPTTKWRLSPDFGWKGDVDSYHAEQRRRGKAAPAAPTPSRSTVQSRIISIMENNPG